MNAIILSAILTDEAIEWTNYCYLDCSDSILKVDQCDEGDAESHPG